MNKELLFAKTLEKVKDIAKMQGNCISEEQVQKEFEVLGLNNDQLQMVYDYLVKHKVGIGQPVNIDDYLSDEEKDYLQTYLDEIAELPTVTEGEKEAITLSAMAGDPDAQYRLTEIYLPDVIEIAKLYAGQGVLLEDLIGEGNVAVAIGVTMLGCLENASEAQGMMGKMIMDAMENYIQETVSSEKADQKIVDKVNKVQDVAKELSDELKRKVTVEELMLETGMSRNKIMEAIRFSGNNIEYIEVEE
jgi:RNA polymerase primary sigma factor